MYEINHSGKLEEPADGLRNLDQLQLPDARMAWFGSWDGERFKPITQEIRYEQIALLALNDAVPTAIKTHYDAARNVYLYAWFVYRFHVVAEQQVLATLELALRTRLISEGILNSDGLLKRILPPKSFGGEPREKYERVMLSRLLELASKRGFLRNDLIEKSEKWAQSLAQHHQSIESIQQMDILNLSEMAIENEEPIPTKEELDFDWISHFIDKLPSVRNSYAHGSSNLHASVLRTFEIVQILVNQLYSSTHESTPI